MGLISKLDVGNSRGCQVGGGRAPSGSPCVAPAGSTATGSWPRFSNLWSERRWLRRPSLDSPTTGVSRVASVPFPVPRCPRRPHTAPYSLALFLALPQVLVVPGVPCCHTLPLTVLLCPSVSLALPHCLLMPHATPHCPSLSLVVLHCPTLGPRCRSHSAARGHRGERGGGPWTGENTQKRPRGWKRRETPGNSARGLAPPWGEAGTAAKAGLPAHC